MFKVSVKIVRVLLKDGSWTVLNQLERVLIFLNLNNEHFFNTSFTRYVNSLPVLSQKSMNKFVFFYLYYYHRSRRSLLLFQFCIYSTQGSLADLSDCKPLFFLECGIHFLHTVNPLFSIMTNCFFQSCCTQFPFSHSQAYQILRNLFLTLRTSFR